MSNEKKIAAALAPAAMLMAFTVAVALMAGAGALSFSLNLLGCYQPIPFILGGEIAGPPALGWGMPPWAFGSPCDVTSLPLYFNAHGFGFPMTLGNYRIGLIPSIY
jgi:hypothetical protein